MKGEQRTVEDLVEANRRWRLPKEDGGGGEMADVLLLPGKKDQEKAGDEHAQL